ncbi:Hint domain-containing protein [Yoonia sp. GPGPB17]|uniref:Hint domain-containing protein n=1 Tax=Yoonia sp. GPGPB17 TaxID=3026147 RepID=UPI0030C32A15
MPDRLVLVYSAADLGITGANYNFGSIATGGTFTASATAAPTAATITDTDSEDTVFNDGVPGNFAGAPTQQLLNGTVDGIVYTNAPSNPENEFEVFDSTGTSVGFIYDLHNANSASFGSLQGYVTTFEIVPGETYTVGPPDGLGNVDYDSLLICFVTGTRIETVAGPVEVQNLSTGDLVVTKHHGVKPILWIGKRKLSANDLSENPKLRPVRIGASSLGKDLPERDLLVSRQHRMLISSNVVERMFEQESVLIAAIKLVQLPGIEVCDDVTEVEYVHLLLDRHEVIFAEGAPTESLYTGKEALKSISLEAREEVLALFPELAKADYDPTPVSMIPENSRQRRLVDRLAKNKKMPLANHLNVVR